MGVIVEAEVLLWWRHHPTPTPPHQGEGLLAGATHGLNAPPGTAEATGLSNPSGLTDETPNTQSSTRMLGSVATTFPIRRVQISLFGFLQVARTRKSLIWRLLVQFAASVGRHRTIYS